MNEQVQKPNLSLARMIMDEPVVRKHKTVLSTPSSPTTPKKHSTGKYNCLCSPTTHAGSFRCRYHRNSAGGGLTRNSISVGAKLSDLASISEIASARSTLTALERSRTAGGIRDQLHVQ